MTILLIVFFCLCASLLALHVWSHTRFVTYATKTVGLATVRLGENRRQHAVRVVVQYEGATLTKTQTFTTRAEAQSYYEKLDAAEVVRIVSTVKDLVGAANPPTRPVAPTLTKGKALVICGVEGSGKSTLARQVADENEKSFAAVDLERLVHPFAPSNASVWIIDFYVPRVPAHLEQILLRVKEIVSCSKMRYNFKGESLYEAEPPQLILCIDPRDLHLFSDSRRFEVVEL